MNRRTSTIKSLATLGTALIVTPLTAQGLSDDEAAVAEKLDALLRINERYVRRSDESFDFILSTLSRSPRARTRPSPFSEGTGIEAERGGGGARFGLHRPSGRMSFRCWLSRQNEALTDEELEELLSSDATDQLVREMVAVAAGEGWTVDLSRFKDLVTGVREYQASFKYNAIQVNTGAMSVYISVDRYIGALTYLELPGGKPSQRCLTGQPLSAGYLRGVAMSMFASRPPYQQGFVGRDKFIYMIPDYDGSAEHWTTPYHRACLANGEFTLLYIVEMIDATPGRRRWETVLVDAFTGAPLSRYEIDFDLGSRGAGSPTAAREPYLFDDSLRLTGDLLSEKPHSDSYGRLVRADVEHSSERGQTVMLRTEAGAMLVFVYDSTSNLLWRDEFGEIRCWRPDERLRLTLLDLVNRRLEQAVRATGKG
jgi:hypothetical protein